MLDVATRLFAANALVVCMSLPGHLGSDQEVPGAPRAIAGFRYEGEKPHGMHEYVHELTGLPFVYIPGGTFIMGAPLSEKGRHNEEVQHQVTLSPYLIAKYELTQEVWEKVMATNRSVFNGPNLPVDTIPWDVAKGLCDKVGLELPTEAQWEYACRAGVTGEYCGEMDNVAWCGKNSKKRTHDVGTKQPNAWGLYDMQGNVSEWCMDWCGEYAKGSVTDPKGPSIGTERVLRGSNWFSIWSLTGRSAVRPRLDPSARNNVVGFRPARSLQP